MGYKEDMERADAIQEAERVKKYGAPHPGSIIGCTKAELATLAAMQNFHKDQESFNVDTLDDALEDLVNHPNHYKSEGVSGIECIDAIQAALTEEEFVGFCKGNNIKYTWRANRKQDVRTNIKKAIWYMNKLLDNL